jgi:hypothetical protein
VKGTASRLAVPFFGLPGGRVVADQARGRGGKGDASV